MQDNQAKAFYGLTPQRLLTQLEALGLHVTGRVMPLNSMENRVYEIELDLTEEESANIQSVYEKSRVVKVYRPGRWTREQILQEHEFYFDLLENDIPAVAPLKIQGQSLFSLENSEIWFTIFPKAGGRIDYDLPDDKLSILGRTLARLHNVGTQKSAEKRVAFNVENFIQSNVQFLREGNFLPLDLQSRYIQSAEKIQEMLNGAMNGFDNQRIHGDCHLGNVLWADQGPTFVDLDDFVTGPKVQDIWLLVPSRDEYGLRQRRLFLEAFSSMTEFNTKELQIIEGLRALRYVHYASWIARRYEDPIFQNAFPDFNSWNYWSTQVADLEGQQRLLASDLETTPL